MKKLALPFIIILFFTACIETPEIAVKDIRLDGIVQGDIKLKIMVDIHNTNNFSVTLKSVKSNIYNDDVACGTGQWEGEEVLEANSTKTLPFLVTVDKDQIMKFFIAFFKGKNSDLPSRLRVDIKAVLKKFGKTFNYSYSWSLKDKNKVKKSGENRTVSDRNSFDANVKGFEEQE